jgi:hypothetical protein
MKEKGNKSKEISRILMIEKVNFIKLVPRKLPGVKLRQKKKKKKI